MFEMIIWLTSIVYCLNIVRETNKAKSVWINSSLVQYSNNRTKERLFWEIKFYSDRSVLLACICCCFFFIAEWILVTEIVTCRDPTISGNKIFKKVTKISINCSGILLCVTGPLKIMLQKHLWIVLNGQ